MIQTNSAQSSYFSSIPLEKFQELEEKLHVMESKCANLLQSLEPKLNSVETSSPNLTFDTSKMMMLRFSGITDEFFTDRAYPDFIIELLDSNGKIAGDCNLNVEIEVLDSYKKVIDKQIYPPNAVHPFLIKGIAEVKGLKFSNVSSKHGDSFFLRCTPEKSSPLFGQVREGISQPIKIFSCRLFWEKFGAKFLSPSDPVDKIKGMGEKQSSLFQQMEIKTIQDLANIHINSEIKTQFKTADEIVAKYRSLRGETRGSITLSNLTKFVEKARVVCSDHCNYSQKQAYEKDCFKRNSSFISDPSPKKVRLSEEYCDSSFF